MSRAPIPVTVLGGYLGAGKTTLLNQLLRQADGRRLAVLVNDFGSINVDAELIASQHGETISLTNGCVCCSIQDNLGAAFYALARAADPPEQIVIEASGVANPLRLAQYALGTPGLRLDGTIVLADAETVRERADDQYVGATVRRQLAAADLLVLTKLDLVSAARVAAVRAWLRALVPAARVVEAVRGQLPLDLVLGPGALAGGGANASPAGAPSAAPPGPAAVVSEPPAGGASPYGPSGIETSAPPTLDPPAPDGSALAPPGADEAHTAGFATFTYTAERPLDRARLAAALDALPPTIVRAKGFLDLADDSTHRVVLQLVGKRWELERGEPWGAAARRSQLVLIAVGDRVNWDSIVQRLEACS